MWDQSNEVEYRREAWEAFRKLDRLQKQMSRSLAGTHEVGRAKEFLPVNLWINVDEVIATAELPGAVREALEVSATEQMLTLKGTKPSESLQDVKARHRQKRETGEFIRTVELPVRIHPERVSAKLNQGILWVMLPRTEADKPKRIAVTVN